ncbi:zinc finger protein 592 [Amia ocellicauda]|uniref:zinc finger protein 592 n=1 Tax=Amia ocellicauda TaxID=2972642 RepID=UPI0034639A9E
MGDMKTPDFDDLLAAFDIPDATSLDAKEAIHTSHDEAEGHQKPAGMCLEENVSIHHVLPAPDLPAVSVIVKNTSRQESFESGVEKDACHLGHSLLHNGFRSSGATLDSHHMSPSSYGKFEPSFLNGDSSRSFLDKVEARKTERVTSFSQFSPISSPEPEDSQDNGIDDRPKQEERPYFPAASVFVSAERSMLENLRGLPEYSMFDQCSKREPVNDAGNGREKDTEFCRVEEIRVQEKGEMTVEDHAKKTSFLGKPMLPLDDLHNNNLGEPKNSFVAETCLGSSVPPRQRIKSANSKLSSCLAALAALNAKKVAEVPKEVQPLISREPLAAVKETVKVSSKVPKSPKSPRSPLEVVKRFNKQPDSPMSVCSDSSGKASPSLTAGSPPAIPRVRIKTIKTSSGQIKRTVTSVLPDSELEELQSPPEMSPSQYVAVDESLSKPASFTPPSNNVIDNVVFENGRNKPSHKNTSTVPSPGVASKLACMKPGRIVNRTATVPPSAAFHNASSAIMRVVNVVHQKQQKSSPSANTNLLPKAVHLANLNLVPHSVAASVTARSATQHQSQSRLAAPMVCSTVPLVHQVKKAAPLPTSSIPSAAVGALNRLLNAANPVPSYVPNLHPPPESNIRLPARGYRCLECGDSFGLEKSLQHHYSRRSVHIEVACTHCARTLLFFNKCSLLAHAREHKSKGIVMQCTQLFMKPISADQMFVSTHNSSGPPTTQSAQLPSSSVDHASNAKGQAVMPLYPDKVIRHGLKCLDCSRQLRDYPSLASHYQRCSEETEGLTCQVCMMMLPNKCSFKAHQRIHAHKSPYCCPECGAVSHSTDFQKHVKENCLHYARKVGYKCLHCDVVFMSFYVQKTHIEEKHCEVFFKCSVCPMAFKSPDSSVVHIKSKHQAEKASPQLIYKCSCETVFKKKKLLFQHFYQNVNKLLVHVFKCPECQLVFTQKQMLMQHFKGVHGGVHRTEVEESLKQTSEAVSQSQEMKPATGQPKLNRTAKPSAPAANRKESPAVQKSSPRLNLKNAGWTCGECLHWLPDRETYVSHMKKSHGRSMKRYPCRQCERSFNSTTSLRRHIRNDHDGKKKSYTCWYCTDEKVTFTKHFMLKNHISLMHGIKNPDFSQMAKIAPSENSSKSSTQVPVAKRSAEDALAGGGENAVPEASPAKRLRPQFRCSKCGFSTEDSTQFQEHIPQHKTDDGTFQCLRCGLCFTSQLSLSRHLFIVHKVKEPDEEKEVDAEEQETDEGEQEERAELGDKETGDPVAAVGPINTNSAEESSGLQCNICSKAFENEPEYVAHVRTHGMSFLKAKQNVGPEQ